MYILLVFEFLLGTLKTLLCSVSAPQVNIVPLLDALGGTLTHLDTKLFALIVFYNGHCFMLKY
jgi:hypothetical protein